MELSHIPVVCLTSVAVVAILCCTVMACLGSNESHGLCIVAAGAAGSLATFMVTYRSKEDLRNSA